MGFDPDTRNTVIEEDRSLLDTFYVVTEVPPDLSSWLLRIKLQRNLLISWKMQPRHICEKIGMDFRADEELHCEFTTGNVENQVIRILAINKSDTENSSSDLTYLRKIAAALLDRLELQGIKDIKKVFMKK